MTFAKLLEIQFQGYFLCRIATDPDPTNEERGVSGYTMALVDEDPLDQVIRTQITPDFAKKNLREPAERMGIRIGVDVSGVAFDGKPFDKAAEALAGAKLFLEGRDEPFEGPIFDSRNNIVGSDDNMAFVVNPFELVIRNEKVSIRAVDHLNPADPQQKIWQIEDPATYQRRLPTFTGGSMAAQEAIRVFDWYSYFRDRRRFLADRIRELEKDLQEGKGDPAELEAKIQGLRTRIYQIEFWGDRFLDKLAFQLTYSFNINGPQTIEGLENLGGKVDTSHPWPVTFWFGSWDGDLLTGWMQGALGIPFLPDPTDG
ncbi:MAG TPA: hypothetical protein VE685_12180 [Thermoanaerobaculia bacterium]|nr:hypothetical protein [Thermoanaerobaculia bacterium]